MREIQQYRYINKSCKDAYIKSNKCVLGLKAKARIESTVYQLMRYILGRARDELRLIEKVCLDCLRARQGTECILGVKLHVILLLNTLHGRL